MGGNTWLASMLDEMPLGESESNIKGLNPAPNPAPVSMPLGESESNIKGLNPAPAPAPAPAELKASDEGTGFLTAELLRRAGATPHGPGYRVAVRFADAVDYPGLLTIIRPGFVDPHEFVVRIDFDDGDVEFYTQRELYMEIAGW
jgi:hypothetical protein